MDGKNILISRPPADEIDGQDRSVHAAGMDGRQKRGVKRRQAMVDAARALFMERGYRRTSLSAIIERAGGSREMIYSSFGGKAGLLGAIISDVGGRLMASFEDEQLTNQSPREALTSLGLKLMDIWCSPEGVAVNRMVLSEGLDSPEILEIWYRSGYAPFLQALSSYITLQCRDGQLTVDDPALAARQFQLLLIAETALPTISHDIALFEATRAVERCVDLLMRAYG